LQKGKRGRPAYPAAYEAIFDDVEAVLTARGACQGARFVLFSRDYCYSRYKRAREHDVTRSDSAQSSSSSSILFDGEFCCWRNCLGDTIAGSDAVSGFARRSRGATKQATRQVVVDKFILAFPGVCVKATKVVLGVSAALVTSRRKRLRSVQHAEASLHGLVQYRKQRPNYRLDPNLLE